MEGIEKIEIRSPGQDQDLARTGMPEGEIGLEAEV